MVLIRFLDTHGRPWWGRRSISSVVEPLAGDPYESQIVLGAQMQVASLLAPAQPPNIFAIGRNYLEHAREMTADVPTEPLVFLKATSAVIGPDSPIHLPAPAPHEVDYEAELAVVIGRTAKDVPMERAMEHVLGFTCANDVTARDCQHRRDKQWARGKSFDTFCPLGPCLVTPDELDPSDLRIRSLLNGEPMQDGRTSQMIFSVPQLIHFLSHQFTLLPGTVILTGTPPGVGAARTPPIFLKPGDEIVVEVEGIGRLVNSVLGHPVE